MNLEITSTISQLVDQIANLYRENLEPYRASGRLQDFTTHISINNSLFRIQFDIEDYWKYIENGRGPGKRPPISVIENWIKIKPIIPDGRSGKIPDTRQLAYAIATKIGREGYKGHKPLHKTLYSDEADSLISAIKQEISLQIIKYITQQ